MPFVSVQLDLFTCARAAEREPLDQLYTVAHLCRGEPTLEIAIRWDFGTPSDPKPWWILKTTGNRIYPYWIGPKILYTPPAAPPDAKEFYYYTIHEDLTATRAAERSAPTIADLF